MLIPMPMPRNCCRLAVSISLEASPISSRVDPFLTIQDQGKRLIHVQEHPLVWGRVLPDTNPHHFHISTIDFLLHMSNVPICMSLLFPSSPSNRFAVPESLSELFTSLVTAYICIYLHISTDFRYTSPRNVDRGVERITEILQTADPPGP